MSALERVRALLAEAPGLGRACDLAPVHLPVADPDIMRCWNLYEPLAVRPPSFGPNSYYFGANVPGKPRRYLLNSAGRPKLLADIAEQEAEGFPAFRRSRRE